MAQLEEIPEIYGPTRETVDQLRDRCSEALHLNLDVTPDTDILKKGREILTALGADDRPGIAPIAMPQILYSTRSHNELLQLLLHKTWYLNEGGFRHVNGQAAIALIGAMGIGKSTTMKTFTDLCGILFPRVAAVYTSCLRLSNKHPLGQDALYLSVAKNLRARGYIHFEDHFEGNSRPLLFGKLQEHNIRIVIMVDELDRLYIQDPKVAPALCLNLHDVLEELAYLGDQTSGRILTFICGSSSRLPQLILAQKDAASILSFPMLASATNLNGTKFTTSRVYSSLPTDLETAMQIIREKEPLCRFMLFSAGATVRDLEQAASPGRASTDVTSAPTSLPPSPAELRLRDSLLDWMMRENEALLKPMMIPKIDLHAILGINPDGSAAEVLWEKRFKACPYEEAQKLMGQLQKEKPDDLFPHPHDTRVTLQRLQDANLIVLDNTSRELWSPKKIYPCTIKDVALLYLDEPRAEAAKKTALDSIAGTKILDLLSFDGPRAEAAEKTKSQGCQEDRH